MNTEDDVAKRGCFFRNVLADQYTVFSEYTYKYGSNTCSGFQMTMGDETKRKAKLLPYEIVAMGYIYENDGDVAPLLIFVGKDKKTVEMAASIIFVQAHCTGKDYYDVENDNILVINLDRDRNPLLTSTEAYMNKVIGLETGADD